MSERIRNSVERGANDVEQVVAAQRRRRRLQFWLGFATIAIIGGLWAGLTTDPLGPGLFGDEGVFDQPADEIVEFQDFEVPTTVGPADFDTTTTGPTTSVELTTAGPTTSGPTTTGPPLTSTTGP